VLTLAGRGVGARAEELEEKKANVANLLVSCHTFQLSNICLNILEGDYSSAPWFFCLSNPSMTRKPCCAFGTRLQMRRKS
jgi:hypothetical protein